MNDRRLALRSRARSAAMATPEPCWSVTVAEVMADLDPGWLAGVAGVAGVGVEPGQERGA